jgi:site-specific DNA-methyltransferase (adenine-specific)
LIKNSIINSDVMEGLKILPDNSIDCVVTSPPYWSLRDYGVGGQLGLEPTFQEYIQKLCNIFDEVKRILKKEGTCWVNIGDTYSTVSGSMGKNKWSQPKYSIADGSMPEKIKTPFPDKSLCQIPSRFAIEMTRRRGYIVKNETDEAWLGGIIEGEGCITIAHHNGYYEPRVQIAMVNKGVLDRVQQITGVGTVSKQTERNNPKWRDSYIWKASGSTAAKICSDIFDYLVSKKEQARIIWRMVEMQKERERTGGDPYSKVGQKYSEKQMTERQKLFEEIKKHNQGNGTPTKLKNPTKNEPWILRNTIIWHKPNCMPSSAKDRFTVDFEKIFFFVKNKKYWFNQQFEPYTEPMNRWGGEKLVASGESSWDNGTGQTTYRDRDMRPNPEGRNKRAVWSVNTKPYSGAHFATFPEKLIEPMVLAGCPEGGVVLDPFFGSGTTGVVAIRNRRNYIGIELNPEYIKLANDRIQSIEQNLF